MGLGMMPSVAGISAGTPGTPGTNGTNGTNGIDGINGTVFNNVDDINNVIKNTVLKPISTWDDIIPDTYGLYFNPNPITLKSPNNPPPLFTEWDYCVDIGSTTWIDFEFETQTVNFGKNRGTSQLVNLDYKDIGKRDIRAYFQIESYSNPGTFYKTPYVYSNFFYDIVG